MKAAIITIAGLSSRFNKGIAPDQHKLKAIYHEGSEAETLLYHMLTRLEDMDRIILVAGYRYDDLMEYIETVLPQAMREKIRVTVNDHYDDWSSGYSLYLGIKEVLKDDPETIIFAEGDLDVDNASFSSIVGSDKSIITCNHDLIHSSKAVIGYRDEEGRYKYAFSSSHGLVSIDEPFSMLFNSGQIWKFTNSDYLRQVNEDFEKVLETGTNLIIVADYFAKEDPENIELIEFKRWVNCNTREDYRRILAGWESEK